MREKKTISNCKECCLAKFVYHLLYLLDGANINHTGQSRLVLLVSNRNVNIIVSCPNMNEPELNFFYYCFSIK